MIKDGELGKAFRKTITIIFKRLMDVLILLNTSTDGVEAE